MSNKDRAVFCQSIWGQKVLMLSTSNLRTCRFGGLLPLGKNLLNSVTVVVPSDLSTI